MSRPHRILVVDDVAQNRLLLGGMVKSIGYEVETASHGLEVLAKLSDGIDLVLLDVMMPGVDGFEVLRRIRAHATFHDLPVIMVTALDSREDRVRSVEAGASDFIAKPVDRSELRIRISLQIRMKDAQDEIRRCHGELAALVPLGLQEKWDGTGSPQGLAGDQIPLAGRVGALVAAFVALTSGQPGEPAVTAREALSILRKKRGTHFDPQLFDLFAAVCGKNRS
jgi:response regulator RpfG family c-di-GMP phosphodiesterase